MKKENIDSQGRPILPLSKILENQELADMAPDSTKRNKCRPHTWKYPLITKDEWENENPYQR